MGREGGHEPADHRNRDPKGGGPRNLYTLRNRSEGQAAELVGDRWTTADDSVLEARGALERRDLLLKPRDAGVDFPKRSHAIGFDRTRPNDLRGLHARNADVTGVSVTTGRSLARAATSGS